MKNQELLITKLSEQYAFNYRERHKPLRSLCFSLLSIDKSRIAKYLVQYHWDHGPLQCREQEGQRLERTALLLRCVSTETASRWRFVRQSSQTELHRSVAERDGS
jgi:hypothetical protein